MVLCPCYSDIKKADVLLHMLSALLLMPDADSVELIQAEFHLPHRSDKRCRILIPCLHGSWRGSEDISRSGFFLPDQNFQLLQSFCKFHRGICPASKNPENFQLAVTQP